MPATDKSQLLTVTIKEYDKLTKLIEPLTDAQTALQQDGVSIKDVVGHRAHWIELFLGWYRDGQAGHEVFFPAKGYKWNELKLYNANLRAAQASMNWTRVKELLVSNHDRLVALIEEFGDEALYGGPMKGGRNDWTTGRWAEAAGASHYRSASKFIRSVLKNQT